VRAGDSGTGRWLAEGIVIFRKKRSWHERSCGGVEGTTVGRGAPQRDEKQLQEDAIRLRQSGRDESKQLPAPARLPFLTAEQDDVRRVAKTSFAKITPDTFHRPERAAFGESAGSFSTRHFVPEFVCTLCPVVQEKPPEVFIPHDSQLYPKTARSRASTIHP